MAHLTRHELKHGDEFGGMVRQTREFFARNGRQITTGVLLAAVVGAAAGIFRYREQAEDEKAGLALGHALRVYHGFIQTPENPSYTPPDLTFSDNEEKFEAALQEFADVFAQFPNRKAGGIARIYMGLCQAELGRQSEALKTLEESGRHSDPDVKSLALFSLAGEKVRAGEVDDGRKIYQDLLDRTDSGVAPSLVQMALADTYRATQPEEAKRIYNELQVQFATQPEISVGIQSLSESLPDSATP